MWRHPERLAVFIGDYVDRGPENIRTCRIVMDMQAAGAALAIMGNHEFNNLAFHTAHPDKPGEYLREHSDKNRKQMETTLAEYDKSPGDRDKILEWMRTLPLWLELPGLRVVHAWWNPNAQNTLKPYLAADNSILREHFPELAKTEKDKSKIGDARSQLLSGAEYSPGGLLYKDADGHQRDNVRLKWWKLDQSPQNLPDLALGPPEALTKIPDKLIDKSDFPPDTDTRPVIFGHYWRRPKRHYLFLGPRHVCVDASIAKGGKLAAYRFSGEAELRPGNLVFSR